MSSEISATCSKIIAPLPVCERGRPFKFQVAPEATIIYCHSRSVYVVHAGDEHLKTEEIIGAYQCTAAKFSPCKQYVAIGDVTGTLRVFQYPTKQSNKPVYEGGILGGKILDIAWSKDSKRVFVCGESRATYVAGILLDGGKSVGILAGPTKTCTTLTCGDDGMLAVGSDDFTVTLFKPDDNNISWSFYKTLKNHSRFISAVTFNSNSTLLATASADGKICIYDGQNFELTKEFNELALMTLVTDLAWDDRKKILYSSSTDGIVRSWSIIEGRTKVIIKESVNFGQQVLGLSLKDTELFCILLDGSFRKMNADTLAISGNSLIGHCRSISTIKLGKDGELSFSADVRGRLVDWKNNKIIFSNKEECGISNLLTLNSSIFAVSNSATKLYQIGNEAKSLPEGNIIESFEYGSLTILIFTDKAVFFDSSNGSVKGILKGIPEVKCAAILNDIIFLGCQDKTIRRLIINNNNETTFTLDDKFSLVGNRGNITAISASGNGLLAVGDDQRRIQLYNLQNNEMLPTKWCFHNSTVSVLAWSHNGEYLISGGLDNAIIVWSPSNKASPCLELRKAHSGPINIAKWIDGKTFCSTGQDAAIRFWSF